MRGILLTGMILNIPSSHDAHRFFCFVLQNIHVMLAFHDHITVHNE